MVLIQLNLFVFIATFFKNNLNFVYKKSNHINIDLRNSKILIYYYIFKKNTNKKYYNSIIDKYKNKNSLNKNIKKQMNPTIK
jgi:hypothetical protein